MVAGEVGAVVVELIEQLQESASGAGGVLAPLEQGVQESVALIGRTILSGVINAESARDPAQVACPGCCGQVRMQSQRPKQVRTLLGAFTLTRGYYYCRGCRVGFAPMDERLGITGGGLSPGLVRACTLAGAEMAFAKGREFITTVTSLNLTSTSTLARATRAEGTRARELITAEHQAAGPTPPGRVPRPDHDPCGEAGGDTKKGCAGPDKCYIVIDGTGAPMLPGETAGRAGKEPGA